MKKSSASKKKINRAVNTLIKELKYNGYDISVKNFPVRLEITQWEKEKYITLRNMLKNWEISIKK